MAKFAKLKSAIKRWPSLTKLTRSSSSIAAAESEDNSVPEGLHAVYVGKSRRRYLVGSEIICHPLLQELIDRSSSAGNGMDDDDDDVDDNDNNGGGHEVVVCCEVVLFEHLLWMLENDGAQLGSMDELVEFYTC
ncbi:SMALL AUXIN UPREGULATED RNA 77 [Hibiscus trionum]|uniref:SMALL AUXIN UPREGULATED RNA 77 n=1 Tax=Hibiscus trionum TaxID=183268 RepID=A0A9W7M8W4_HIBTR|nr:SMALL AUXIN UPREGULATED RNA 77 [Hibiscus trionum]